MKQARKAIELIGKTQVFGNDEIPRRYDRVTQLERFRQVIEEIGER